MLLKLNSFKFSTCPQQQLAYGGGRNTHDAKK